PYGASGNRSFHTERLQRLDELLAHLLDLYEPGLAILRRGGVQQLDRRYQNAGRDLRRSGDRCALLLPVLRETGNGKRGGQCGLRRFVLYGLGLGLGLFRFPFPVSRVRSATSGCQPTVRMPSADRANRPTRAPPAVPTA